MNVHEYQAKQILEAHGVNVQRGEVASTADEAEAIARQLACHCISSKRKSTQAGGAKAVVLDWRKLPKRLSNMRTQSSVCS